jgi:hypothetical protein
MSLALTRQRIITSAVFKCEASSLGRYDYVPGYRVKNMVGMLATPKEALRKE